MKKLIAIISMVFVLCIGNAASVYADAAAYDIENAGYYVYVKASDGGVNFRSGPSVNYGKVMSGMIPNNTKLYISHISGKWGYTSYNGYDGWVALSETSTSAPKQYSADYYVYVNASDGGVNFRSGPSVGYGKVMSGMIPNGTRLYISSVSGNWGYTSYNGYVGWIALSQTTSTLPSQPEVEVSQETDTDEVIIEAELEQSEAEEDDHRELLGLATSKFILVAVLILIAGLVATLIIVIINHKK